MIPRGSKTLQKKFKELAINKRQLALNLGIGYMTLYNYIVRKRPWPMGVASKLVETYSQIKFKDLGIGLKK
jgi:hypothetical protein